MIKLLVAISITAILAGLLLPAWMHLSATPVQGPGSDPPATAWLTSRADDQGFRFHSEWRGTGEGDGILIVEVLRGGDLSQSARVNFTTRDGTARAAEDYVAQAGILVFAPGEARKSISVSILNDARKETPEDFMVELSDPSPGARIGSPDRLTVTINDDDRGVQFIRSREGAELANEDAGAVHLLIARQDDLPGPVAVRYATLDGTARAGEDYTGVSGTLTFERGRQDLLLTVPILNDGLTEGDEAFSVELSAASPDTILGWVTSISVTILDNDAGTRFVQETNSVLETAGVATVRVLRGTDGPGPVSVRYATADGTALDGREYTGVSGTLTFSGDEAEIRVPLLSDEAPEPAKSFHITLSKPIGGVLGAVTNTVIEIQDADTPVISGEDVWVLESAGAAEVVVRRRLGEKHGVVVGYTTKDGSARAGEDYAAFSGELRFAPGEMEQRIRIPILDDGANETNETFQVVLSRVAGPVELERPVVQVAIDGLENVVSRPRQILGYGSLEAMAVSPDDCFLLTGGNGGVFLWELATGELVRSYGGFDGFVDALAFSPDGKKVLAGGADVVRGTVPEEIPWGGNQTVSDFRAVTRVWDLDTGELLRTFEGAGSVGFSPDGKLVITSDGVARVNFVFAMLGFIRTFSSGRGDYRLWDVKTGELRQSFERPSAAADASDDLRKAPFAFSPDGTQFLAPGRSDRAGTPVCLWDAATGELRASFPGHRDAPAFVAFSADGSQVITAVVESSPELPTIIRWWDTQSGSLLRVLSLESDRLYGRGQVAISPDGSRLLRVGLSSAEPPPTELEGPRPVVELLDAETGRLLSMFAGHASGDWENKPIHLLSFSSGGTMVFSAGSDQTVRAWNVASGPAARVIDAHGQWPRFFVFSWDGKLALTRDGHSGWYTAPGVARLWQVRTGTLLHTFGGDSQVLRTGAFSRDGRRVLVGGRTVAELWDLDTGALVWTLTQSDGTMGALDLSPDGDRVLIGSWNRSQNVSSLWDVPTGRRGRVFNGGAQAFFSPDGAQVLTHTGPGVGEVSRLWDVSSGGLLHSFPGEPILAGASPFSADGQHLYVRSSAGLQVRDAQTGAVQRTLNLRLEGDERFLALSPDARFVLTAAGPMGAAQLRESGSGALVRIFDHGRENQLGTEGFEISGTFAPSGDLVATWLGSHSVSRYPRVWDISDLTRPVVTVKRAGAAIELNWPSGELQLADAVNGPWTTLAGARSPYRVQPLNRQQFYRALQEWACAPR